MKFKRFTKRPFLLSIGREHLGKLFSRFTEDLATREVELPDPAQPDDAYFTALARMLLAPEGLPAELVETLFVIEEMATAEGQERLEAAATAAGLDLGLEEDASRGEIAVQAWLRSPKLLVTQFNRVRLSRLTAFDYYGSSRQRDQSRGFERPSHPALEAICHELEGWFREHNRGRGTTHVEMHELDGEYVFPIRHGDAYVRTVKINGGRLEPLHFRPAKDDLVIYTPQRDEIRIHAETKGEQELYRRAFGWHLRGDRNHFCQLMTYTLEPLRTEGLHALRAGRDSGIAGVGLREVEMLYDDGCRDTVVRKSEDLFLSALRRGKRVIPNTGKIVRAIFDIQFVGTPKSRRMELRPPNTLRLGRNCDTWSVQRWMSERGFRTPTQTIEQTGEAV
jgi:hypothetical protein